LAKPDLIKQIEQILQSTELDARSLKMEIAESCCYRKSSVPSATILQLKALGVQLQIDQA